MNKANYSRESISRMTTVLPRGTRQEIAEETNEPYTTVANVWQGRQYKKNIVDAIERRYRKVAKRLTKEKSAA